MSLKHTQKVLGLEVRTSRIGKGIFTMRSFKAGERMFVITGAYVSGNADDDMDTKTRNNMFRFDRDGYISPRGSIGDFLNHSCAPNAKVVKSRGKLCIVAISRIQKDAEMCIDYSTITASDDEWAMRCRCGTARCRKTIRAFANIPEKTQVSYISKDIVPRYILAINKSLTTNAR